ncbi:hypothetical protein N480_04755 [Pseudoalteromonas luteoviolacea S2607]|nr:hypothetical protein N480_04755 [Pseudoalteromonas luteoviolacea S2607]
MALFKLCSKPFITELTVIKDISPSAIPAIEKKDIKETKALPFEERLYLSPTNKLTD